MTAASHLPGRPSAHIVGTGSHIPERVLTNQELEAMVETSDEWIRVRTGIRERRVAGPDEAASDMGLIASVRALSDAGVSASDLDLILVATCTPDMMFPNTASIIQTHLGASRAVCMDISAACSGFVYALETASRFIQSGAYNRVLIVGTEKMSAIVDWHDRSTCILFGDAAGAAVVCAGPPDTGGVLDSVLGSDGQLGNLLMIPAGGSRAPTSELTLREGGHFIKMAGRDVFKYAVTHMTRTINELLERNGLTSADISLVVPHQANLRIIHAIQSKLGVGDEKVFVNVDKYGNTSAASVILALDEAVRAGRVKKGDILVLVAFGAGFTWGASLIKWSKA
jgi:3-oxoacyl-[acyl-carrier-protein] synthase III